MSVCVKHVSVCVTHVFQKHISSSLGGYSRTIVATLYTLSGTNIIFATTFRNTSHLYFPQIFRLSPYTFLDGYCSTVQGLLDWFEVDLGFTELLFIQIDLCVMCG